MIPVKLTIQGIYSYQKKQVIDFTKFTQASIFGIFGAVGSGKSTILEAITFALYGKTDRLNLSGDNRNYNMMNLKSNELFIEFIFQSGEAEYMAVVKGRRNSKQFDDVKTLDRTAYKRIHAAWEPIGPDSIESIIGLSYENFKRTIIIPQGKFQEFLQLSNKERSQMMKELFNLDKFELFCKVVSLESRNNQQLQNIEGKIQQIGSISPEQLIEKEECLKVLKSEIEEKTREQLIQQQKEKEFGKLKELTDKIQSARAANLKLQEQEPEFRKLEIKINEYEYCLLKFKTLLDQQKQTGANVKRYDECIAQDEAQSNRIVQDLQELEKTFEPLKTAYTNREQLRHQADELRKMDRILALSEAVKQLEIRISNGEKICKETEDRLNLHKQEQDALMLMLKELRATIPDMTMLSAVKQWHTINQMLIQSKGNLEKESEVIGKDLESLIQSLKNLIQHFSASDIPEDQNKINGFLEKQKEKLLSDALILEKELNHLQVQTALEEYAAGLENGKPCPLCGSISHPAILNSQNVAEALEKTIQKQEQIRNKISMIEQDQKKAGELLTRINMKNEQIGQVLQKSAENQENIASHLASFTWDASFRNEEEVQKAFTLAAKLRDSIAAKEQEIEKKQALLDAEEKNKLKSNSLLESLRHQLTASTTEITTLKDQLNILSFHSYENKNSESIRTEVEELTRKYNETERMYLQMEQQMSALRKDQDTLQGRLEANRKSLQQEQTRLQQLNLQIEDSLRQSQYTDLSRIEQILNQQLMIEQEKKRLETFRQALEVSSKQLESLKIEIGDQVYDESTHKQIQISLQELGRELTGKNQDFGKLQNELTLLKDNLKMFSELKELSANLQARAENIRTLKQLFKASGFVNFISSVYLQDLCNSANERFYRLTRHRLSLEMTSDNNFLVRDFMNGGKTRSVKTLSGGQTFQAALSLALALADNIQELSGASQNFFFLDEGFGSLDKESLEIVFDTLKALRKENRIVGVISHVEEMQQEIDAHLRITNDEEKGSLIETSF